MGRAVSRLTEVGERPQVLVATRENHLPSWKFGTMAQLWKF